MPTNLRNLTITEGSLVDEPANPLARVVLFKRAREPDSKKEEIPTPDKPSMLKRIKEGIAKMMGMDHGAMTMDQVMTTQQKESDLWEQEWKMSDAFHSSVRSIMNDENMDKDKKDEMLRETMEQYHTKLMEHMQAMMDLMEAAKGNAGAQTEGAVSMSKTEDLNPSTTVVNKKEGEDSVKTLDEFMKSLSPEDRTAAEAEIAKRVQPAKFELPEEIAKRLDAATKAATDAAAKAEVLEKRAEAAEKRADAAEAMAKAEQEARVSREYLEKAAKYPNAGTAIEVADILRKAYGVSKEYGEKLEETLGKTEAVMAQSKLFQEVGKAGRPAAGSATERLEKRALEAFPGKNLHAAVDEFLKTAEGKALYTESLTEVN